jgi:hypothetical protein
METLASIAQYCVWCVVIRATGNVQTERDVKRAGGRQNVSGTKAITQEAFKRRMMNE